MKRPCWLRKSRLTARFSAVVILLAVLWVVASAQGPAPPYALFDQAILTGSGNTITATQIPVVTGSGAVVYLNAKLLFNVDTSGNLTIASGYPQVSQSPALLTSGFKAGTYVGPSNVAGGKAIINVSGPGVTDGGATMWSLSSGAGASASTYPLSATWYVGPIANNPNAARISKAAITSTALSYGIAGGPGGCTWGSNGLIGASQIGNTLTLVAYSSCGDSSTPIDQITYTLMPTP